MPNRGAHNTTTVNRQDLPTAQVLVTAIKFNSTTIIQ